LERADDSEEEQLESEPLARSDPVEDHVGGDFKEDDPEREHLLSDVELVLVDPDVFHEVIRQRVGNIASVYGERIIKMRSSFVMATTEHEGLPSSEMARHRNESKSTIRVGEILRERV
jgi:hypothetical protein